MFAFCKYVDRSELLNIRVFLFFIILNFGELLAGMTQSKNDSILSLLKSAVVSGINPAKLLNQKSSDANSLLLFEGKKNNSTISNVGQSSGKNVSMQQSIQQRLRENINKSDFKVSASSLPNNANKMNEKDRYFGQHELCESEIIKAEKKYGIPNRLLLAISTVESGRFVGHSKKPWPWTICANGRGYFCTTKSAAIATAKRLMARGIRNIDVGCMQVNLLHHSTAFKNLEEAFTPKANVNYAAKFFLELKNTYNSWTHAVGYYHSKAAKHYKPYCSIVYNAWNNVRNVQMRDTPVIAKAASQIKSNISFLPSYYSLVDNNISAKLHQLGRKTLIRSTPKFFIKKRN